MNLEFLLALSCAFSNNKDNACLSMGNAYYKYEKLDERVHEIEKHLPTSVVFTATLLSGLKERKATVPITHGIYFGIEFPTNPNEGKGIIGFQRGF